MILSRRTAHFYMVTVLCCTVPLVAIAALVLRPSIPSVEKEGLFTAAQFVDPERSTTVQTFTPLDVNGIEVSAQTVQQTDESVYLELHPQQALEYANVLVYWLPPEAPADQIDDQAILLGQLAGTSRRQFPLPKLLNNLTESPHQLLFYSQGQAKVIDTVSLTTTNAEDDESSP